MMSNEAVQLSWADLQHEKIVKSFESLRRAKDFLDVTLVSDDAKQFQAHKLVLSACSSFFKKILIGQSHPQPLVYLSGVHSSQLAPALDYIYRGQVVLPDTELETFIVVAQRLGLEGLAGEEP